MAYHVLIDGDQRGPFETASVVEMIDNGEVGPDTLVWTAGMDDWQPAEAVAEIASALAPREPEAAGRAPPPPSPGAPAMATQGSGRLAIGAVFGRAFSGFTHHPFRALLLTFVGLVLPVALIAAVGFALGFSDAFVLEDGVWILRSDTDPVVVIAVSVVMMVIWTGFIGGLIALMIGLARREPVGLGRLFAGFGRLLPLFFTLILIWVMVVVGMFLVLIPGFFLAIALFLAPYFSIDERIGPFAAIGASYRGIMRLGWWRVFGTFLVTLGTILVVTFGVMMVLGLTAAGLGATMGGDGELAPVAMLIAMGPMMLGWLLVYLFNLLAFGLVSASIYEQARAGGD